jgi:PAS domain-containing protein
MATDTICPPGKECPFGAKERAVGKTNSRGHIIYANDVFPRLAKYPPKAVIGVPLSLIRQRQSRIGAAAAFRA